MKLSFKIAWRFLKSSKAQSILILIGIAVGVSVQVFLGSLIQGLQKSLIDKTIGHTSQITVLSKDNKKTIGNYKDIEKTIAASDSRIEKISSVVDGFVFLKQESNSYSMQVRGFEFKTADRIYDLNTALLEGTMPKNEDEVMLGKQFSIEGNIKSGDTVKLVTAAGNIKECVVKGIFDLKVAALNKTWLLMTREGAQSLLGIGDNVTSIETQVNPQEVLNADMAADAIQKALSGFSDIKVNNWKAENESLLSGLNGQSASSGMIQAFVLISVVLGIASVLAISVVQKSKQLGILKAMGIKDRDASLIFIFEGLILGCGGAIFGVGLGFLLSFIFTKFALNADGTPIVPLYINYTFIAGSAVVAVLAAVLAALLPARKSSKLTPVEVIKNG